MTRRVLGSVAVLALILAGGPLLMAESSAWKEKQAIESAPDAQERLAEARAKRRPLPLGTENSPDKVLVFGTIMYDNGVANVAPTVSSNCYGNRFDTALNGAGTVVLPVMSSGSITMVSFYMASASGNAFISIADQLSTGAGTAMNITSASFGPFATGFNTQTFPSPINYVGSSFLAGIWYFGGDVPGLGTGTTGAQGIHGMFINDSPSTLTGYTPSTTFNAIFRATGDLLTPVELTNFSVTDE